MNFNYSPPEIDVKPTFGANKQTSYLKDPVANLSPSSFTGSSYSLSSTHSQQSIEHNDFYDELIELKGTLHKNFVRKRKTYTIYLHRDSYHHAIVISDGRNDPITLELTVMGGKAGAVMGGGRTIAKVVVFTGDTNDVEEFGEVTCTLYELTQKAAEILNSNRNYNWISNNCQHFCTRFLEANGLPSYTTDTRKVVTGIAAGAAAGTATAATIAICNIL